MTTRCPICRNPMEVDDALVSDEGYKATCPLCDEVFVVRPPQAEIPAAPSAPASGGTRSSTPSHSASASGTSASRRLLEEDSGDGAAPRVLVAHDSHAFGDVVRTLLEEEGFDVEVVHDGEAALAAIDERSPAVAILEAGLPKRFGFQICADVKGREEPSPVKVLLVASVYDRRRLARSSSMSVAPDEYLEPRNVELELVPKVKRLLRGRESTGSRAAASVPRDGTRSEVAPRAPEMLPTSPAKRKDPTHPTHPTMGEEDFAELFEESASVSKARDTSPPAPDAQPIDDVDAFLASSDEAVRAEPVAPVGGVMDVAASSELAADEASESGSAAGSSTGSRSGSGPRKPLRIGDEPVLDSDEREIWDRVLAEEDESPKDDDELLRTLMEMANGSSEPSISEDSSFGVPEDSLPPLDADSDTGDEPNGARSELDDILDQVSGPKDEAGGKPVSKKNDDVLRAEDFLSEELPGEDYSGGSDDAGIAPAAGPLDLPSHGSVPDAWKPDADERRVADDEEPDIPESIDEEDPQRLDVITAEDLGLGTELGARSPDRPRSESSRPTAKLREDEAPDRRRLDLDAPTDLAVGVVPPIPADTPTVLRKGSQVGRPDSGDRVTEDLDDGPKASPPPVTMEDSDAVPNDSFNETALVDDERSLAEARAADNDDDVDSLLESSFGGSESGAASKDGDEQPAATRGGANGDAAGAGAESDLDEEHAKAKRLAKLIVGDILLYNAEKIPDAVRSGTFFDVMKGDIKDGRDFYDEKVPDAIRAERDYIQELLDETLANKKKELGLS